MAGHMSNDDKLLLQRLPFAAKAVFNHYDQQSELLCLKDTRTYVLEKIMQWARGQSSGGERVFWLNGMAGTSKSTIARTVARQCADAGRLGASFFFSRGGGERETARKLVTTIAVQLAARSAALRKHICDAVRAHAGIAEQMLRDQWKQLVLQPLAQLSSAATSPSSAAADTLCTPLVVVIDALNECRDEREVELVLQLVSATSDLAAPQLLIFLTSRPEIPMRMGFADMPEDCFQHLILHRVEESEVNRDIRVYLKHHLSRIARQRPSLSESLGDAALSLLVDRAGGLFIWAATACRFVEEGGPRARRRLDMILRHQVPPMTTDPDHQLDEIYSCVLRQALRETVSDDESNEICHWLRILLGTIVVLFSALSGPSLDHLLYLPAGETLDTLSDLHSIFDVPSDPHQAIRPHHASVRDFLLNHRRCTDARFLVGECSAHTHIARQCLQLMGDNLRQDICGLQEPGTLIGDVDQDLVAARLPRQLRYACVYWAQHIQHSDAAPALEELVTKFMREHFLHWLEALSLLGKLSDGVDMVALLESLYDGDDPLPELIADTKRFVLYSRPMIEAAPLQAYLSAIVFTPAKSLIRELYLPAVRKWLRLIPETPPHWNHELMVLEGGLGHIRAVSFSPNNKLIAAAYEDGYVGLWNAKTGAPYGKLQGHSGAVAAVAFSPDSKALASTARDNTILLWEPYSGAIRGAFAGHLHSVDALAFSPDGNLFAAESSDKSIALRNVSTGCSWSGASTCIRTLAFSPDGTLLASVYDLGIVRLWNAKTGAACGLFDNLWGSVPVALAFWPNGELLVATANKGEVLLSNASASELLGVFRDHPQTVHHVAFSPNGRLIASATASSVVAWCTLTGGKRAALQAPENLGLTVAFSHDNRLLAIPLSNGAVKITSLKAKLANGAGVRPCHMPPPVMAFSSSGRHLASAAYGGPIQLWDVKAGVGRGVLEPRSYDPVAVLFSLDDQLVIHLSSKNDATVWNSLTNEMCSSTMGHRLWMGPNMFSLDGEIAAGNCDFCKIEVWNTRSGEVRNSWKPSIGVKVVAISLDGELLFTQSRHREFKAWTTRTGSLYSTIDPFADDVVAAISNKGRLLTIGDLHADGTMWDIWTGSIQSILEGGVLSGTTAATFSPDGRLVACTGPEGMMTLWNADTCKQVGTAALHGATLNAMAFSPDGRLLACSTADSITLWDTNTNSLFRRLDQRLLAVTKVVLSADGNLLAPAPGGRTVRVWSSQSDATVSMYRLGFSADGKRLLTFSPDGTHHEIGVVTIPSSAAAETTTPAKPSGRFTICNEWLEWDGTRLLWLPYEYRPVGVAQQGNTIAMALEDERVVLLTVDLE